MYRRGHSAADPVLVAYVLENGTNSNRVGIVVSKKIGNSVVRSRVKRIIKEGYRALEPSLEEGYDLVFLARPEARVKKSTDMEISLRRLLKRLKVPERAPEKELEDKTD